MSCSGRDNSSKGDSNRGDSSRDDSSGNIPNVAFPSERDHWQYANRFCHAMHGLIFLIQPLKSFVLGHSLPYIPPLRVLQCHFNPVVD